MASIYTLEGNELTTGLQGCKVCDEAIDAAQRFADELQQDVELHDDDGVWLVHPRGWEGGEHGTPVRPTIREPADFLGDPRADRIQELETQAQCQGGLSDSEQAEYQQLRG